MKLLHRGEVMLFDELVKENIRDFYDRRREMELLKNGILECRRIILILGIRRIGKSSLIKVTLNHNKIPYIYIDVRSIYRQYNYISSYAIHYALESALNRLSKSSFWSKLLDYLKNIRGVSVMGVEVRFSESPQKITVIMPQLFNALNDWASDNKSKIALVFDEAQYLRYSKINFRSIIAYIYDNLPYITVVLSGSEVGLLHDFLRVNDPRSELYGRYMYEIVLKRFNREQSIDFLYKGFQEYGIEPPTDIIEEAASAFGGIVGWLVYFGRLSVDKGLSREVIIETFIKGSKLVKEELSKLYKRSPRYRYVLEAIAQGNTTWSSIKKYITARELKPIYDSALYEILLTLEKMGIIEKVLEKDEIKYKIVDPVLQYAVMH